MPRVKSWKDRIPLIIQHLDSACLEEYTRIDIERLFIIGRSRATDLMKIAGATVRPGAEASVSRKNLRYYVERCPEAKQFLDEQERKAKVDAKLQQAAGDLRLRSVAIPGVSEKQFHEMAFQARWEDLTNVVFERGIVHIAFTDEADLLQTLVEMNRAMVNEPELFRQMCETEVLKEKVRTMGSSGGADWK